LSAQEYQQRSARLAAYSLAGVQKLCSGKTLRAASQLPRWLEFDVICPWQRRHQIAMDEPVQYKE
jgi:hypothetical protein